MTPRRVSHIHFRDLIRVIDQLPSNIGRDSLVHHLISSPNILDQDPTEGAVDEGEQRARVLEPIEATREEICAFHGEEFIGKFP